MKKVAESLGAVKHTQVQFKQYNCKQAIWDISKMLICVSSRYS